MKKLLYLMAIIVFVLACTEGKPTKTQTTSVKGPYLAKVNDVTITKEDVMEEFNMLPPQIQEFFTTEGGMESLLDELVKKELLYQEAKKRNFSNSAKFKKRVEDFKKRLMIEYLLEEEIEKKALVSDKEVRDFYEKNKENFVVEIPGKEKPELVEFDKVKDFIQQRLTAEKQREIFDSYITSLKKTYKVELDKEAIKKAFGN
jgi:peptidyl-prolyl cis-trans isomerase C